MQNTSAVKWAKCQSWPSLQLFQGDTKARQQRGIFFPKHHFPFGHAWITSGSFFSRRPWPAQMVMVLLLQRNTLFLVSLRLTPNQQIDSCDSFGIRKPTAVCCRWKNHQLFKLTKELLLSHTHAHTSCCVVDICIYWQRVCAHVLFSSSVSPTCH